MSYILDALRRADAERDRGAVPDLNAQHLLLTAIDDAQPARAQRPWGWLAAGGAIVLVGLGLWKYSADAPAVVVASVPPQPAPMSTTMPTQMPTPMPMPMPSLPGAAAVAPPATSTPAAPAVKPPTSAAVKAPAIAAAKPLPSPPPAPAKLPTLAELPDSVRRELPALNVGGSVYSEQAAARMVIVNGQVFREGDLLAPGLLLERIAPKSAIFAIRGQRFELRF